jgi:hypothetical protein
MKNKQLNTLLITFGIAVVILYIARPKNNLLNSKKPPLKVAPPKTVKSDIDESNKNGMIIIDAMRNAIKDKIPQKEVDMLQKSFLKEYSLKVFFGEEGKLIAKNNKGKIVARE